MLYLNKILKKIAYCSFFFFFIINCFANEGQFIRTVSFKNTKSIKKEELEAIVSTRKKSYFNQKQLDSDIQKIKQLYYNNGYFSTEVSYKLKNPEEEKENTVKFDKDTVDLEIEIKENKQTKIKNIKFVGNKNFTDSELKSATFNKEHNILRTFSKKSSYNKDLLQLNELILKEFYLANGYLNFKVISIDYEQSDDENRIDLTIKVEEGEQYRIGEIEIINDLNSFDEEKIKKFITIKQNEVFNIRDIRGMLQKINAYLIDNKYIFVDLNPQIMPSSLDNLVNIKIFLSETQKQYINNIIINGNSRTYNYVILDSINILEGDIYNERSIQKATEDLVNLDFFKNVNITKRETNKNNKIDLIVDVEEKATGTFNFGVGFSSLDGISGNVGFAQRNLLGKAINLNLGLNISQFYKNINFGFEKNNIFNTNFYGGVHINFTDNQYYKRKTNNFITNKNNTIDYGNQSFSFEPFVSYRISEDITHRISYIFETNKYYNINKVYANIFNKNIEYTSAIDNYIQYDTRNNFKYPTKGFLISGDLKIAGLFSNKYFVSTEGDFNYFLSIYKSLVFKLNVFGGAIKSFNGHLLYPMNGFYMPYEKFRGFAFGGINPVVLNTNSENKKDNYSLTGNYYYALSTELRFPILLKDMFNIYGAFFYNIGTLYGVEKNSSVDFTNIKDIKKLRSAAGFALFLETPMGNIGLEWAKAIQKQKYDNVEHFKVVFKRSF